MGKSVFVIPGASVLIALAASSASASANLVINGDFSAGNTGFQTGYALTNQTPYLFENGDHGIYTVETASSIAGSSAYGDWTNIATDPSGNDGEVFVADGSTASSPNTIVWEQTVAVKPNTDYAFSYYAAEVSNACCSNASFSATIDGTSGGALSTIGSWQKSAAFTWNSGSNTSAVLSLTDLNASGPFNDFALTDIALIGPSVPEPATWAIMLVGFGGIGAAMRQRRAIRSALKTA